MQAECSSRWMGVVVIVVVWSSMGVAVGSARRETKQRCDGSTKRECVKGVQKQKQKQALSLSSQSRRRTGTLAPGRFAGPGVARDVLADSHDQHNIIIITTAVASLRNAHKNIIPPVLSAAQ